MCSILGAIGPRINRRILNTIREAAQDRGRDGGRLEYYLLESGFEAVLGNWRATPTPELETGPLQPYDRLVHNGTIANDQELGAREGEIDSQCLARVLDRTSLRTLATSLQRVKGSYALAVANARSILCAVNYKPLHYVEINGSIYFSSMARHFASVLPFGRAPVMLAPYTAIDLDTREIVPLHTETSKRAVVIASAGLDSTVVATKLVRDGWDVCLLHVTYGCLAGTREYDAIPKIAAALGCTYQYLEVDLKQMLGMGSSTLFGDGSDVAPTIAGAEFAVDWVPARNFIFIALATGWAEANGYHAVALGNNLEEAGAFCDNEEEFTHLLDQAVPYAVHAHYGMRILSPIGNLMKHEISALGLALKAPLELTWSCYRGGDQHCGQCGPCFMRRKAFERNGAIDPVFGGD